MLNRLLIVILLALLFTSCKPTAIYFESSKPVADTSRKSVIEINQTL